MSDMGGLQLLPETRRKIEIKIPGRNRLVVFAFVFGAIVAGLYLAASSYRSLLLSSISDIDREIADLELSRDKETEQELVALHSQLSVVGSLLDSHFLWSDAFTNIQTLILPQVQFQTLTANVIGNKLIIKGLAANYTIMARQIAALYTLEPITDIILNRVSSHSTGNVEFTMEIKFNTSKLLNPSLSQQEEGTNQQ